MGRAIATVRSETVVLTPPSGALYLLRFGRGMPPVRDICAPERQRRGAVGCVETLRVPPALYPYWRQSGKEKKEAGQGPEPHAGPTQGSNTNADGCFRTPASQERPMSLPSGMIRIRAADRVALGRQ
jgi:hypothetical protein